MPPKKRRRTNDGSFNSSQAQTSSDRVVERLTDAWRSIFVNEKGRLYLMIDFGTSKHSAVYATDGAGLAEPLDVQVHQLSLENTKILQPASLGLAEQKGVDKSGEKVFEAVHGEDVKRRRMQGEILSINIFRNLKQSTPFINVQEMDQSQRADYLRTIQEKHAKLLEQLRESKVIIDHKATSVKETMTIETMKDVVRLQLRLLCLDVKAHLKRISNASFDIIDEMFSGDESKPFGTKLQVGVAAPELWDRSRLMLYGLLIDAGFSSKLEILSESKCAAAAMLRKRCDETLGRRHQKSAQDVANLMSKIVMVVDRGGHTLVSSMILTERVLANLDRIYRA